MPRGERAISERGVSRRAMREDWGTPDAVFAPLDAEFHFTVDAACTRANRKVIAPIWNDALTEAWDGHTVWLNPPYGHRNLGLWIQKAWEESQNGATVVCLVPSHTGQRWWIDYATKADEIRWIPGKVKFVGASSCAPFYSAILVFRPRAPDA